MFFLKSIRRRLVTGSTVALAFMLLMTVAAVRELIRHEEALANLKYLIHDSPDKAQLYESVNRIVSPLSQALAAVTAGHTDLSSNTTVVGLRNRYLHNVRAAQEAARDFWKRSEQAANDPGLRARGFPAQRNILQRNMESVQLRLKTLADLAATIDSSTTTSNAHRTWRLQKTTMQASLLIAGIAEHVQRLPDYDKDVVAPLLAERQPGDLLLRRVLILAAITLVSYAITIYCGFRWISNPLRTIASGASRIANGDTRYRLGTVTPWRDEFFNLVENFNRMADRFQESEDDLSAKVEERSRQLVRSERLADVGILAAGLAHEVNNPLQSNHNRG